MTPRLSPFRYDHFPAPRRKVLIAGENPWITSQRFAVFSGNFHWIFTTTRARGQPRCVLIKVPCSRNPKQQLALILVEACQKIHSHLRKLNMICAKRMAQLDLNMTRSNRAGKRQSGLLKEKVQPDLRRCIFGIWRTQQLCNQDDDKD